MEEPVSPTHSLENEDWETVINILINLDTGVNGSRDTRKLKKKIGIVRQILYSHLSDMDGSNRIDLSFLIGAIKTIENLEREFDEHGVKGREFLIFFRLLIYKLEKQKLIVNKPMERRFELEKLKEVVEEW